MCLSVTNCGSGRTRSSQPASGTMRVANSSSPERPVPRQMLHNAPTAGSPAAMRVVTARPANAIACALRRNCVVTLSSALSSAGSSCPFAPRAIRQRCFCSVAWAYGLQSTRGAAQSMGSRTLTISEAESRSDSAARGGAAVAALDQQGGRQQRGLAQPQCREWIEVRASRRR